jgi:hypothetical protein
MNSTVKASDSHKLSVNITSQRINPEIPLTIAERDAVARGVVRFNQQRQCRKGRLDNIS